MFGSQSKLIRALLAANVFPQYLSRVQDFPPQMVCTEGPADTFRVVVSVFMRSYPSPIELTRLFAPT